MKKAATSASKPQSRRPALTPEARENQLIALAVDLAEEQMLNGTASSQVLTHFLKLGTEKAKLEREKLQYETELIKAKKSALESDKRIEALYEEAIKAFQGYSGQGDPDDY